MSANDAAGKPASFTSMSEVIRGAAAGLSRSEVQKAWEEWRTKQQSPVTVQTLEGMARARREGIDSAHIVFKVTEEALDSDGTFQLTGCIEETFLMEKDKVKIATIRSSNGELKDDTPLHVLSYDGNVERAYDGRNGEISRLQSRQLYFYPYGPLAMQMLLDSEHDLGVQRWRDFDLVAYFDSPQAVTVAQTKERIHETEALVCVCGSPPQHIVWLDTNRDFAVIKTQRNWTNWADKNRAMGVFPSTAVEAADFVDCGNGIWIPRETTITIYSREEPGKVEKRIVTEVSEVEINVPIDDAEFTDIFPPGTKVRDAVAGETYYTGTIADAERDLTETLEGLELDIPLPAAEEPEAEPAGETQDAAEAPTPQPPLAQAPPRGRLLPALAIAAAFVLVAALVIIALRRRSPQG